MTSYTTILNTSLVEDMPGRILSSYESTVPYRRVPPPKSKQIDPAPDRFRNTIPELIKNKAHNVDKKKLLEALGESFQPFKLEQKVEQTVGDDKEASQRIEQVLKSSRDWR